MVYAAGYGDIALLEALKEKGASPAGSEKDGLPIIFALRKENNTAALWFAENGGLDNGCEGVLQEALAAGGAAPELLQCIINHPKFDPNKVYSDKGTPLHAAVAAKRHNLVDQLMARDDIQPTVKDSNGATVIDTAAMAGDVALLEKFIAAGVPVAKDGYPSKDTLLSCVEGRSQECTRAVVAAMKAAGMKPALDDMLVTAAEKGVFAIVKYLVEEEGCDPDREGRRLGGGSVAKPVQVATAHQAIYRYFLDIRGRKQKGLPLQIEQAPPQKKEPEKKPEPQLPPDRDGKFKRLSAQVLQSDEGGGLTMTFNFWTQQVVIDNENQPQKPSIVQNFNDIQRTEAIAEAHAQLIKMGGTPAPIETRGRLDKPQAVA